MLKHVTGNLIDLAEAGNFNVIVQGCNCFTTMGSGIAKEIKDRYPAAYEADVAYNKNTLDDTYDKLGNYSVMLGKQFNIVNAYTQHNFNRYGETADVFNYAAFELILDKLANRYPGCKFGLPYIGCGLAGGSKEHIIDIIRNFAYSFTRLSGGSVTLVKFG
jgi:O-acetyl-ADP-ribose deacetylase (regulator of RNase III)